MKRTFDLFYCLNYVLGVIFFLGYYAVIDHVISMCFGAGLEVSRSVSFIITLNEFTKYMRKATLLFRDASGTFYYDRWKPIVEGIVNLILSLILVHVLPEELRITGVIVATILTTLFICDIVDPYVVFKYVFRESPYRFWMMNYIFIGLFVGAMFTMTFLLQPNQREIEGIVINGLISLGVSTALLSLIAMFDRAFREKCQSLGKEARLWIANIRIGIGR